MMKTQQHKLPNGFRTVHYFNSPEFTVDGKPQRIIASERIGRDFEEVRHTIKKHTGELAEVEMATLVKLFQEGRLV